MPRTHRFVSVALLAAAVWVCTSPAIRGQGQVPLPTGREIVTRYVAVLGGARAYASVRSIRARGRLEIAAQGISGELEMLSARPARLRSRVTVPGIGLIENGYDGRIGWSVSPTSGPELLKARQLSETADDAQFDGALHAPDHVRELTTLGLTEFDGRPAYKVKVVMASGNEQSEYFDVEAGLQIGSEAARALPQGVVQTVNILRNYRKFGALMQATTFVQRALGLEQVITINSYEYDVVPDAAFNAPADVKALIGSF
jgi:hypothetical protein